MPHVDDGVVDEGRWECCFSLEDRGLSHNDLKQNREGRWFDRLLTRPFLIQFLGIHGISLCSFAPKLDTIASFSGLFDAPLTEQPTSTFF